MFGQGRTQPIRRTVRCYEVFARETEKLLSSNIILSIFLIKKYLKTYCYIILLQPMPYRRNFKRRSYNRKPMRKTRLSNARKMTGNEPHTIVDKIASGVGTVATIAKNVSMIASLINVEDKFVDTQLLFDPSPAVPSFALVLNQIAQGNDYNQRNGNKVLDKCLQINMRMFLDATATTLATNTVRFIVLIDKKPQIGPLTFAGAYTPTDVAGMINKNTVGDRIVVLKDLKVVFNGSDQRLFYKKFYINLSRIHTQYTGPNATDYESNAIYVIGYSDLVGLQPAIHIRGTSRFCYLDN